MPTYEYRCERCSTTVEVVQSFADAALTTCEVCGAQLRKVYAPVGIVFKGSGFYKTDSRSSASRSATSTTSSDGASASTDGPSKDGSKDGARDGARDGTRDGTCRRVRRAPA